MSALTEQDPMEVFLYALRAPETRRQYPRRLKVFFDYLELEGSIEQQAIEFLAKVKQNLQWAQNSLMQFITFQKERAKNGEKSYLTIGNYYKATKLFIEMNTDTVIDESLVKRFSIDDYNTWFIQEPTEAGILLRIYKQN